MGTCLLLTALLLPSACITEPEYNDSPRGNFEALWKIMDEHYCFFREKQISWDSIHRVYAPRFNDAMTDRQQFEVLADMLAELRDGHVNLTSPFNVARYWAFHESYPSNYSDTLTRRYLGTDYQIASGLKYRILDDNIGYIRCESFQNGIGDGNLDEILLALQPCTALIIDLRNNGGGLITSAEKLAARFTNKPLDVGFLRHKTGRAHDAFSALQRQTLRPARGIRWQKRVAVLTNRMVFSAANEFVKYMKCCPLATIVGDRTGGGAGLPFSSELPNGWNVRFSACPMFDREGRSTEDGIAPDVSVGISEADFARGRDTIIETARQLLKLGKI